ncbi:MAG: acyl-CoA desaturase [Calothrix sp. MO_167.B12]|nr:acyl-CoA desaturase [Calothrix sp. MO_167.B12]
MQLDSVMENSTNWSKKKNITIKGDHLKNQQLIHALVINIIPLVGTILAVAIALQSGVKKVEIGLLISLYLLTLTGVSVGFHRLFSHSAFQAHFVVKILLTILGSMACQGPLIYWVSNHRRHHQYSDKPGDPHSPYCIEEEPIDIIPGLWHAQVGWTFTHEITNPFLFAKDLLRDSVISKVNQLYYVWVLLGLVIPTVIGGMLTGTSMGLLSGFLWGGCVRLFLSYHFTNSINSITHLYGNRPFDTREHSTNNIWLAVPTGGEAWHNNHHAFPNSAKFGLQWWQVDFGYYVIRVMEVIGLAWNVKTPTPELIEAKKAK